MRRYVTRLILMCLSLLTHAHAAEVAIPDELQEWRGWVLHDEHYRECPFIATASEPGREDARCAWPGRLALTLDARGGTFTQTWQIFAEDWVRIPGSTEHWPQNVQANGKAAPVVARNGAPHLLLTPGTYTVSGRLSWDTRPESLAIDARTGIVDLMLDGRKVAQPERPNGAVWLGKRRSAEQPARMEVQVYRLLQDGVPATLITRMRLQVSGEGREETLARVLSEGFSHCRCAVSCPRVWSRTDGCVCRCAPEAGNSIWRGALLELSHECSGRPRARDSGRATKCGASQVTTACA